MVGKGGNWRTLPSCLDAVRYQREGKREEEGSYHHYSFFIFHSPNVKPVPSGVLGKKGGGGGASLREITAFVINCVKDIDALTVEEEEKVEEGGFDCDLPFPAFQSIRRNRSATVPESIVEGMDRGGGRAFLDLSPSFVNGFSLRQKKMRGKKKMRRKRGASTTPFIPQSFYPPFAFENF